MGELISHLKALRTEAGLTQALFGRGGGGVAQNN